MMMGGKCYKCYFCGGTGVKEVIDHRGCNQCPICDGTGLYEKKDEKETEPVPPSRNEFN